MISFDIKINNEQISNYLLDEFSKINLDNVIFSKKYFSKYINIIIHYTENNYSEFYNKFSEKLCSCILKFYEPFFIKDIIRCNYFYFDNSDIQQIFTNCIDILNSKFDLNNHFNNIELIDNNFDLRKDALKSDILNYVVLNKFMILDGFVKFRIKDYLNFINDAVDIAVNQFVIDKEYNDFIDLLNLYVNSKDSNADIVYLMYYGNNSTLLDKDKKIISDMSDNLNYLSDISFSSNDYTLNSLLSLLPQKIVIQLFTIEDDFINTLKLIFGNRIEICNKNKAIF